MMIRVSNNLLSTQQKKQAFSEGDWIPRVTQNNLMVYYSPGFSTQ